MKHETRVKVIKGVGDFEKALKQGFAVNLHNCSDGEMILVLPVDKGSMNHYLKKHGWVIVE